MLLLAAVGALLSACDNRETSTSLTSETRTIQISEGALLTSGKDWIYRYSTEAEPQAIIGEGVEFIELSPEELVVNIHGGVHLNVPLSGPHPVRIVNMKGITSLRLDLADFEDDADLLASALELQAKKAELAGTGQPATRPESKSEGSDKPQPEAEGRSR